MEKLGEKCINCKVTDLEKISEHEAFCPKCNIHVRLENGKVKLETQKGRIQIIEENIAYTQEEVRKLRQALLGDDQESALPFI